MSILSRNIHSLVFARGMSSAPASKAVSKIPSPRGKCQDVASLFKEAHCGLDSVASKFKSWDALFTSDRFSLKELGLSTNVRRKVLSVIYKFKSGIDPAVCKKHKSIPKSKKK